MTNWYIGNLKSFINAEWFKRQEREGNSCLLCKDKKRNLFFIALVIYFLYFTWTSWLKFWLLLLAIALICICSTLQELFGHPLFSMPFLILWQPLRISVHDKLHNIRFLLLFFSSKCQSLSYGLPEKAKRWNKCLIGGRNGQHANNFVTKCRSLCHRFMISVRFPQWDCFQNNLPALVYLTSCKAFQIVA